MKRFLTILLVGCGAAQPQKAPTRTTESGERRRYVETIGGYSFVPPEGWQLRSIPGTNLQAVAGPSQGGFSPNITFVQEITTVTLEAYARQHETALRNIMKNYRSINREPFRTESGLWALRISTESEHVGRQLRQTFYYFDRGSYKIVATCSTPAAGGELLDPVFEACMKSFRLEGN